jgi:DNA-binding IclR family transcriptional regulator
MPRPIDHVCSGRHQHEVAAQPMTTARDRPPEEAAEDTSFARGLRVLLTIADRGEIRADELGTLLETPASTIYRYLRTLTEFGFAERNGSVYRLGPRLHIGGGANVTSAELIRCADPVLQSLAAETGETAVISRRIGLAAVCLHEVASDQPLRVELGVGTTSPLDAGAISRVLLAYAPDDIQSEFLAARRTLPGGQPRKELRKELAGIANAGIARTTDDPVDDAVVIAVPVMRDDGIVAAVGVIGPESRCGLAWRTRASRLLPEAARAIAAALAIAT